MMRGRAETQGSVQVGAGTCASEATRGSRSSGEHVCWGRDRCEVRLAVGAKLKACAKECIVGMNRVGLRVTVPKT